MITFRLVDSLPATALDQLDAGNRTRGSAGVSPAGPGSSHSPATRRRRQIEAFLDAGYGACHLREPYLAALVEATILHFDGSRYRALAWVVMPNHVHVVVEVMTSHPVSAIVHSWKSFTAKAANNYLNRTGAFWQREYFDRSVRDERHLSAAIAYIHANPVKARLVDRQEDWRFSSADRYTATTAGETPALPGGSALWRQPA
jgi:REP element-mobilizing transposase RayT